MNEKVDLLVAQRDSCDLVLPVACLEQRPNLAIRAIQKGFVLGNHAYSHPHFSDLEFDECFAQIRRTDEIIEHSTGAFA